MSENPMRFLDKKRGEMYSEETCLIPSSFLSNLLWQEQESSFELCLLVNFVQKLYINMFTQAIYILPSHPKKLHRKVKTTRNLFIWYLVRCHCPHSLGTSLTEAFLRNFHWPTYFTWSLASRLDVCVEIRSGCLAAFVYLSNQRIKSVNFASEFLVIGDITFPYPSEIGLSEVEQYART